VKTHYKIHIDFRDRGQTQYEYDHSSACGYVRKNVSSNGDNVDCRLCLDSIHMVNYHAINKTFSDSQGCF